MINVSTLNQKTHPKQHPRRLDAQPHELINRSRIIQFTFNGHPYTAHPGDTIASALAANGVRVISHSLKYHRPRGLHTYGHSIDDMVQVDEDHIRSVWMTRVEDGMDVRSIHPVSDIELHVSNSSAPNRIDDNRWFGWLGRFLPGNHEEKPADLSPEDEELLRNTVGLDTQDIDAVPDPELDETLRELPSLEADVVVIGGSPAGLSAAISAAKAGATVLLFDDGAALGGHLRYSAEHQAKLYTMVSVANQLDDLHIYNKTTVQYLADKNAPQEKTLFVEREHKRYKVQGKTTIFATGAADQPLIFDNNDLPGVMLGSAVLRLLHSYGAACGSEMLIVTANNDGWHLAQDLVSVGINVVAIVEHRASGEVPLDLTTVNVPVVYWAHTVVKAIGDTAVKEAVIAPLSDVQHHKTVISGSNDYDTVACDTIVMAAGWIPRYDLPTMLGCTFPYDDTRHEYLPDYIPEDIFLAGRVAGSFDVVTQILEGDYVGRSAAALTGHGTKPDAEEWATIVAKKLDEPNRTTPYIVAIGETKGKRFVDLDEDITDVDVQQAVAQGRHGIELLKRYTAHASDASQTRWTSLNTLYLLSEQNQGTY
ncbi:MAG: 2Fe-2S iron-sulfur cluster-binding protein [Chloroflexota bacterium]